MFLLGWEWGGGKRKADLDQLEGRRAFKFRTRHWPCSSTRPDLTSSWRSGWHFPLAAMAAPFLGVEVTWPGHYWSLLFTEQVVITLDLSLSNLS